MKKIIKVFLLLLLVFGSSAVITSCDFEKTSGDVDRH